MRRTLRERLIIGCGALNWDIFFQVEDLSSLSFEGLTLEPGREYVLEREAFLALLHKLKQKALLVFEGGGGSAANTIYALASLGFKTAFLGAVGADTFGNKVLEELLSRGISVERIRREGETSLALIILDQNRDRTIIVSPGSAERALALEDGDLFPQALYHLTSLASPEGAPFQKALLTKLPQRISFDPGEIYTGKGKDFLLHFLQKTKYLFITEGELAKSSFSQEELLNLWIDTLFLKRGKKGAKAIKRGLIVQSSVYQAPKIVDNTGAGDYFNAGVLAGLLLNLPLERALDLGLYSASLSLRDYGRKGIMNQKEFKNSLSRLK